MSEAKEQKKSVTQAIKEMLEQGKSDEEIVKWITENLPHVKDPKAYLRAVKSHLRKKAVQAAQAQPAPAGEAAPALPGIVVQQVEAPRPAAPKEKAGEVKEVEEAGEAAPAVEVDEEVLASMYKGIIEIIGVVATGDDFVFPEAKAKSRARLLKKIIEKHTLGNLPWEELSLLGGVAEDALYVFNKIKEKKAKEKAKTALGQKSEEKKEEKAEEKKEEQVRPDVKVLRERLRQIYARARAGA